MGKLEVVNVETLLEKRFGKEGTASREKFRKEAFAFYIGSTIQKRRKDLKLSQEDLAKKIGKKRTYISKIENGENIRLSNLHLITSALNLSINLTVE